MDIETAKQHIAKAFGDDYALENPGSIIDYMKAVNISELNNSLDEFTGHFLAIMGKNGSIKTYMETLNKTLFDLKDKL